MLTHSWWAKLIIGLDVIVPLLCFCPGEFNVGGEKFVSYPSGPRGENILYGSTRGKNVLFGLRNEKNSLLRKKNHNPPV